MRILSLQLVLIKGGCAPVKAMVENFAVLKEAFPEDDSAYETAVGKSTDDGSLESELGQRGFQADDIPIYIYAMNTANASPEHWLASWCKESLEKLTESDWGQSVSEDFRYFELLIASKAKQQSIILDTHFADALYLHAKEVNNSNQHPPEYVSSNWQTVLDCLESNAKNDLQQRLAAYAMSSAESISEEFISLYGELISSPTAYSDPSSVLSQLHLPLLRSRNLYSLSWLATSLENNPSFYQNSPEESKDVWSQRLLGDLRDTELGTDLSGVVNRLAILTGVEVPNVDVSSDDESEHRE